MGDPEDTYCRLCAEPTPKDQLISADEDVAISSKIATKMRWINIDITSNNCLPTTICFSCFDLLERTWSFLHNVRNAQDRLCEIFGSKNETKVNSQDDVKPANVKNAGKPVDKGWQAFQDAKTEIKIDPEENADLITTVDPNALFNIEIKTENDVDNDYHLNNTDGFNTTDSDMPLLTTIKIDPEENADLITTVDPNTLFNIEIKTENVDSDYHLNNTDGFNTTDSDMPLLTTVRRKKTKTKKKNKIKFDPEVSAEDLLKTEVDAEPLDISSLNLTWDDYVCHCAHCNALCKNISSLRLHAIQIHTRCCTFKCSDCARVISNFKTFVNHVRTHKNVLRYCCEYCNKQFTLTSCLKKHLNTVHSDVALMTCQTCGAYFDNEELLQDHLILFSKRIKKGRKKDKSESDLKCDICNKEFKSRSNLLQHKYVHTERSRDFSCHVCGKMFFTKGTLSTHMITHEDTKPFKCEYCPLAFRARGNLQSHISLHSGAKPFVCEQCGKSFRVKRHLKSHSIVHTDLMPYICNFCNKPFRFKTRLNLHLRQHTGAKPYNCIYCQRNFTNGSNFKKHMKRRHNVDTSKKRYNNIVNGAEDVSEGQSETA